MQNFCISPGAITSLPEEGSPGHRKGERGVDNPTSLSRLVENASPTCPEKREARGRCRNAFAFSQQQRPFPCSASKAEWK